MTATTTIIFYYIMGKLMSLGFFSFIVNSFLIILIEKNIFGSKIKNLVENISKSKENKIIFFINYFLFVYILIFTVKYNMSTIYLEPVQVNVIVNGVNTSVTGDILSIDKEIVGDTGIFLVSAKLAQLIISKNTSLTSLSRIGIVLGSGGAGLTTYKVIDRSFDMLGFERKQLVLNGRLQLEIVSVTTTGNYDLPNHPVLSYLFGMSRGYSNSNIGQTFSVQDPEGRGWWNGITV